MEIKPYADGGIGMIRCKGVVSPWCCLFGKRRAARARFSGHQSEDATLCRRASIVFLL